jgi:hypothetical protein
MQLYQQVSQPDFFQPYTHAPPQNENESERLRGIVASILQHLPSIGKYNATSEPPHPFGTYRAPIQLQQSGKSMIDSEDTWHFPQLQRH